ncbi:MAG TPA: nucleoside hydrolase [Alphaproteobacteria bacterium]|nr:nucleoside hydrolase [Alphaproteobacteria bacterium]
MLPLIIDTDPGKDDAVAILLALAAWDRLDVRMLSTVGGNVAIRKTEANARRLCEAAGRSDIAVHAGCPGPLLRRLTSVPEIHGEDGLAGADLPPPQMTSADGHAVPAIIEAVRRSPDPMTLACIAPLTNIALALVMAPDILTNIAEIVVMGGTFGRGNITPYASFNLYSDPHAASIVFGCGSPVAMIGLEITRQTMPSPDWCARLKATGTPSARVVAGLWSDPTAYMNDACVIAYLLQPELFTAEWRQVRIELRDEERIGATIPVNNGGDRIKVINAIDVAGFFDLLLRLLSRPSGRR